MTSPTRETLSVIGSPKRSSVNRTFRGWMISSISCIFVWCLPLLALAQEAKEATQNIAQIIPVQAPLNEETVGQIRRAALELQQKAQTEKKQGFLFLEIQPGISTFHRTFELADFLTEKPFPQVKLIAWVPESIEGMPVFLAMACQEIITGPNVTIGDIGNGVELPNDQQRIVQSVIERRRNLRVTPALAGAWMTPATALMQISVEREQREKELRVATEAEIKELVDAGTVITDRKVIKESGTPASINTARARELNLLIQGVADSKRTLLDLYNIATEETQEAAPVGGNTNIAYIEFHDQIDEVFAAFAERQIDRAVKSGATTIIFEIDSPGGLLTVCSDLAHKIVDLKVKTVAYVPKNAISGGAILAVACDEIYMHADARIGDAIPINLTGNMILHAEEKVLSFELELLRHLAEKKNRPTAVLEGFADKDLEVFQATNKATGRKWYMSEEELHQQANEWIAGPRVPESRQGIAITVNGNRAHDLLIAKAPVKGIEELRQRLGIDESVKLRAIGRTWVDNLIFTLNTPGMTGLLFFLAIVFIYIEVATMTGLFGILSALCFTIFFWSKVMGGTAGGLEIAIFVIGAACLLLEIFVIPGFGVFGISGILLMIGAIVMASQTFTGLSMEYDLIRAGKTFITLGGAIFAVVLTSLFLSMNLHRIPILKNMVATGPEGQATTEESPILRPDLVDQDMTLVGASGKSITILRPSGKAMVNGRTLDVVSEGQFIDQGVEVVIVQAMGNRIVVRERNSSEA